MSENFEDEQLNAMLHGWDHVIAQSGTANRHGMNAVLIPPTACVSAADSRHAYLELTHDRACPQGAQPCLRDSCTVCGPVLWMMDAASDACDARGCSPSRCVYDGS